MNKTANRRNKIVERNNVSAVADLCDAIEGPQFNDIGAVISEEEVRKREKKRGKCRCGTRTHAHDKLSIFLKWKPLTNDDVFEGKCIECDRRKVPGKVLRAWEARHGIKTPPPPRMSTERAKLDSNKTPETTLEEISTFVGQNMNDLAAMSLGCKKLWLLSNNNTEMKIQVANSGTIDNVLEALRTSSHEATDDFFEQTLGALTSLAMVTPNKQLIAEHCGIELVLYVFNLRGKSQVVFEWGCRFLYNMVTPVDQEKNFKKRYQTTDTEECNNDNLSVDREERNVIERNIADMNDLDAVVTILKGINCMLKRATKADPIYWAVMLLWRLQDCQSSSNNHMVKNLLENGFVQTATKLLKEPSKRSSRRLFQSIIELLDYVLGSPEVKISHYDNVAENIEGVIRVLVHDYKNDANLHESFCRLLAKVATSGSDQARKNLYSLNVIQVILDAVDNFVDNASICQSAFWTLWAMSYADAGANSDAVSDADADTDANADACVDVNTNIVFHPFFSTCDCPKSDYGMLLKKICKTVTRAVEVHKDSVEAAKILRPLCGFFANVLTLLGSNNIDVSMVDLGLWESLVIMLKHSESTSNSIAVLELISVIVARDTRHQSSVDHIDGIMESISKLVENLSTKSNSCKTICIVLRNILLASSRIPGDGIMSGIVDYLTEILNSPSTAIATRTEACYALWALTEKHRNRLPGRLLQKMFRIILCAIGEHCGLGRPFDKEFMSSASGAVACITSSTSSLADSSFVIGQEHIDKLVSLTSKTTEPRQAEILQNLLICLVNLTSIMQERLVSAGVVVAVAELLTEFQTNQSIQELGVTLLALLTSGKDLPLSLAIVYTNGIELIVNALAFAAHHETNPTIVNIEIQSSKALAQIAVDQESRVKIVALGGVIYLINAVKKNVDDIDLAQSCLAALSNILSDATNDIILYCDIIPTVISVMKRHLENASIQCVCLSILHNVSMRNMETKHQIGCAGGILAITNAVTEHMFHSHSSSFQLTHTATNESLCSVAEAVDVLDRSFSTLRNLALLQENHPKLADANVNYFVVNGMLLALHSERVQIHGCRCLSVLALNSEQRAILQDLGGVDAIVLAMQTHYNSEKLLIEALNALAYIVIDNEKEEIMAVNVSREREATLLALQRFPWSEEVQKHGCAVLRNLSL